MAETFLTGLLSPLNDLEGHDRWMNTPSEFRRETLAGDEFGVADEDPDALDTVDASVSSCQVQEEIGEESNGDADREELPTMTVAARDESDIGLGHLTGIEVSL